MVSKLFYIFLNCDTRYQCRYQPARHTLKNALRFVRRKFIDVSLFKLYAKFKLNQLSVLVYSLLNVSKVLRQLTNKTFYEESRHRPKHRSIIACKTA